VVAEKKLGTLVKEAPASLSYKLGCIHGQLEKSDGDVYTTILRLRNILERITRDEELVVKLPDGNEFQITVIQSKFSEISRGKKP